MKEWFAVWCLTSVKGKELITWSWHKTKHKACTVGKNGLWPASTHTKKKKNPKTKTTTIKGRKRYILEVGDPCLLVAIFS